MLVAGAVRREELDPVTGAGLEPGRPDGVALVGTGRKVGSTALSTSSTGGIVSSTAREIE